MSIELIAVVAILLFLLLVVYPLSQRLSRVKRIKAYFRDMDEEHRRWWKETAKTLWLTAQTCSLFLSVESVHIPAPFSWLVSAMDFVTLGPLASFFFSPCASAFAERESKRGRVDASIAQNASRRRRGVSLAQNVSRRRRDVSSAQGLIPGPAGRS